MNIAKVYDANVYVNNASKHGLASEITAAGGEARVSGENRPQRMQRHPPKIKPSGNDPPRPALYNKNCACGYQSNFKSKLEFRVKTSKHGKWLPINGSHFYTHIIC